MYIPRVLQPNTVTTYNMRQMPHGEYDPPPNKNRIKEKKWCDAFGHRKIGQFFMDKS